MYESNQSGDQLAFPKLQHPKRRQNHCCKQRDEERHYGGILCERKIENYRHDSCNLLRSSYIDRKGSWTLKGDSPIGMGVTIVVLAGQRTTEKEDGHQLLRAQEFLSMFTQLPSAASAGNIDGDPAIKILSQFFPPVRPRSGLRCSWGRRGRQRCNRWTATS